MKNRMSTLWMVMESPGIRSRALLWLIALFFSSFIVWASYAEVDELVRGEGRVIPSQRLQVIQNLEGGIVSEILVSEGALVEPGQILLKMDDTQFDSSFREKQLRALALQVRAGRLRAEVAIHDELLLKEELKSNQQAQAFIKEEQVLLQRRLDQLAGDHRVIRQQIEQKLQSLEQTRVYLDQAERELQLAQKELDILKPLQEQGVVSEVEILRAEKTHLKAQSDMSRYRFQLPQIEASIEELRSKKEAETLRFKSEAQEELNKVLAELPRLSQSSGALEDRVKRTSIRSPVRGTVKQMWINTVGGVIQPGMDILSIVPIEDSLLVEARVKPADIARLYPGQRARVKFSAYDFSVFGGLDAEVVHISADTWSGEKGESFYVLRVKTERNYLGDEEKPLPIIPGMVAEVDVLTGKKNILAYLLKPVLRAREVALTER